MARPKGRRETDRLVVLIDPEIKRAAKKRAIDEDTTASELIERLLREYLKRPNVNR